MDKHVSKSPYSAASPHVLVIACSDGRLREATDEFLATERKLAHYDRLYLPGGGGALAGSGPESLRAQQHRAECRFLVEAHGVGQILLLFHGPTEDGPEFALCGDYRRKAPGATARQIRAQQERDIRDLLEQRESWAGNAQVLVFRAEVTGSRAVVFREMTPEA